MPHSCARRRWSIARNRLAASALQASDFRSDVTAFRLNAAVVRKSGSLPAFRRNTAARVYMTEAAHNPEVAGTNPAPLLHKAPETAPCASVDAAHLGGCARLADISAVGPDRAGGNHGRPAISNVAGESSYVRVQVLTPIGVLDRDKQLGVVKELTEIIAAAAGDPSLQERTWVLLTESPEGGWGIGGHANTNADIAATARAALAGR